MGTITKYLLILGLPLTLFTACQEPIELDLEDTEPELVIEGYLAQRDYLIPEEGFDCGGGFALSKTQLELATEAADQFLDIDALEARTNYFPFNKVFLSTTANYFEEGQTPRVSGAIVRLIKDGSVVETLEEDPEEAGTYLITHKPQVGSTYYLEIEALENQYETVPQEYLPVPPLIILPGLPTVNYRSNFIGDSCEYYSAINSYEAKGTGDHYRWMFYKHGAEERNEDGKFIFNYVDDPFFIAVFDDSEVDGVCLIQFDIYGDDLDLGDSLIVFQIRTEQGYSEFMTSIQNQTAFVGGPFDTPPAPIRGNLKNITKGTDAFGYFNCGGISASLSAAPDTIPSGGCGLD